LSIILSNRKSEGNDSALGGMRRRADAKE